MTRSGLLVMTSVVVVAAGAAGWTSAPGRARLAAPPPAPPGAGRLMSLASPERMFAIKASGRRVRPETPLTPQDLKYLERDPVEWAKELKEGDRAPRHENCKRILPRATDDTCESILDAFTGVAVEYLTLQQRFLSGDVDQAEYEETFHRVMLEQTMALEAVLPARDYFRFMGMPHGEDSFIDLNGGLIAMTQSKYQIGNDVLERTEASHE